MFWKAFTIDNWGKSTSVRNAFALHHSEQNHRNEPKEPLQVESRTTRVCQHTSLIALKQKGWVTDTAIPVATVKSRRRKTKERTQGVVIRRHAEDVPKDRTSAAAGAQPIQNNRTPRVARTATRQEKVRQEDKVNLRSAFFLFIRDDNADQVTSAR